MTKQVRIVALLGSSSGGKSTVAHYLVKEHGFVRMRFAGPLKDMLKSVGLTDEEVDGALKERPCNLLLGHTPRHAMKTLGTEWRDMIDPRLWARIIRARIQGMVDDVNHDPSKTIRIVIDDMRFPHELDELRHPDWSVTVLAIRRPEVEPTKLELVTSRLPLPAIARRLAHIVLGIRPIHKSEREWFKMKRNTDIPNTGTVAELYVRVRKATRLARS